MYKTADETKPDFSLSGVWIEKDVDTNCSMKISQMNQEESIYGFLANTVGVDAHIDPSYVTAIQKYIVGNDALVVPLTEPENPNRIILKIINQQYKEPIKASITHNTVDKKIEIRVTYTANGISKILDEYGNAMELTEENGVILADTGSVGLAKGTYKFTVVDNKGNKKELSITPNVDSLFKVAYINGTDNMDNTVTYNKTQETKTTAENTLLNQIKATDTSKTFDRAIQDSNKAITAIGRQTRTSADEQLYLYKKYKVNPIYKYSVSKGTSYTTHHVAFTGPASGWASYSLDSTTGIVSFSNRKSVYSNGDTIYSSGYPVRPTVSLSATTSYSFYCCVKDRLL